MFMWLWQRRLKGGGMEAKSKEHKRKEEYAEPMVLASYNEKDLDEMIKPHGGDPVTTGGGGCGCGCGCS